MSCRGFYEIVRIVIIFYQVPNEMKKTWRKWLKFSNVWLLKDVLKFCRFRFDLKEAWKHIFMLDRWTFSRTLLSCHKMLTRTKIFKANHKMFMLPNILRIYVIQCTGWVRALKPDEEIFCCKDAMADFEGKLHPGYKNFTFFIATQKPTVKKLI